MTGHYLGLAVFDGPDPVFRQIADYFRTQILAGRLRDGEQLPSTAQFAAAHKINPGTVTKALGVLVSEGLVVRQRGVGMFVASGAADSLRDEQKSSFFAQSLDPVLEQAELLGVSESAVTGHIQSWFAQRTKT